MDNEKIMAVGLGLFILALVGASYLRHEMQTITLNGVQYQQVGMAEITDNGNKVYMPVYKRITK